MRISLLMSLIASSAVSTAWANPPENQFDVQDLYALSMKHGSIAETLGELPDVFKRKYVLVYDSPSLQASSFQNPRALLFNEDASLIISFNGHPEHRGYDKLEIMSFSKEDAKFEMYELGFGNGSPVLSDPNPASCMTCHQSYLRSDKDPRPNWEPYNVWPRIYGSLGGEIKPAIHGESTYNTTAKLDHLESQYPGYLELQNREFEELNCFVNRQVLGRDADSCPTETANAIPHDRYQHLSVDTTYQDNIINKELHSLSQLLAINNFRRVVRLMREHPDYEFYKHSLAGFLRAAPSWVPGTDTFYLKPGCSTPLSEENIAKLVKRYNDWNLNQSPGYYAELSSENLDYNDDRLNATRYIDVFFAPVTPSIQDWSMDFFSGGRFLHNTRRRFRSSGHSLKTLSDTFLEAEPELATMSCNDLSQEGNRRLSEYFSSLESSQD